MPSGQGKSGTAGSRYLTPAEQQEILDLYQTTVDGQLPTVRSVAQLTGRSVDTVRRLVERTGVYRPEKKPLTVAEEKRIVDLYQTRNGTRWTSTVDIGRLVGRDPKTVWSVIAKAGVNRTTGEANQTQVTEEQRQAIIRLYRTTRLGYPKVADRLGISRHAVYNVLDTADALVRRGPNCHAKVRRNEALCIVSLYQQGRSMHEVADVTDRTVDVVRNLVHDAGVTRTRGESIGLAARRKAARERLAKTNLRPSALRWLNGTETEELAAEHDVPADLMWDALADELSRTRPPKTTTTLECVDVCAVACTKLCALSLPTSDRAQLPDSSPTTKARRQRGPGIPYVRTGLTLPAPGRHSRFGP